MAFFTIFCFLCAKVEKVEEKQKSKIFKIMESDRKRTNSSELEDGDGELLQLQWSNHSTAFGTALNILRSDDTFCDVTLITSEGEHFSAHRVIISACSSHLRAMLKPLPRWQHPVLIMPKDVPMDDLRDIITFMYSGEVHVERGRLESFLHSAELLKVHGLCDQVNNQKTKSNTDLQPSKKMKKSGAAAKSTVVTTTITPAFPLRPSSRNSPKAGPSVLAAPKVKSPNSSVAVKLEEPNYSDEENLPEHMVIPSDPNSIRVTKQEALFDDNYGKNIEEDSIAADSPIDSGMVFV